MSERNASIEMDAEKTDDPAREILPLFRHQAVEERFNSRTAYQLSGNGIFPTLAALSALFLSIAILSTVIFGKITRTATVYGTVIMRDSITKITSPMTGIIVSKSKRLGDFVQKGDVLFAISGERYNQQSDNLRKQISSTIQGQIDNVRMQMELEDKRYHINVLDLQRQKKNFENRLISEAADKEALTKATERDQSEINIKEKLLRATLITITQMDSAKQQLTTDVDRLETIKSTASSTQESLDQVNATIDAAPINHELALAAMSKQVADLQISFTHNEMDRETVIVAPENGIISSDQVYEGQAVNSSDVTMTISPRGNDLEIELLVPASSAGFLNTGGDVTIAYTSFPSQKFGYYRGTIERIFDSALDRSQIETFNTPDDSKEPLFPVFVSIEQNYIEAYGQNRALKAGMPVQARIAEETRYIYEWLFAPLVSVSGSITISRGHK